MNNSIFAKSLENSKNIGALNLQQQKKRNYLVPEPNYHTSKIFTENLLVIEIRKTQILMNKPVYLGLSILHLRKATMYEF